ncbi:hypothetical protein BUALT_Bualt13G0059000 [Buddleja alternifolia]|uniref:peroxidase n=1 Tax=Buddleja alternifolia TaxID=168488 RepID=A0AAV6WW20_9LAMI|nr:hypothetical protein BUALT_Bualt13G0059000 [Buddleja alternifolia]
MNSARGFEVIDEIKSALEKECPHTVSCADIIALAARDSTVLAGGPSWVVPLGRRDSKGASLSVSNYNILAPNDAFQTFVTKFKLIGLDIVDLVALSGSHTIGNSRCVSFRQRLYNQSGNAQSDLTLDQSYAAQLRASYFKSLLRFKGLLSSDQILVTKSQASLELVKTYAANNELFFERYAKSMVNYDYRLIFVVFGVFVGTEGCQVPRLSLLALEKLKEENEEAKNDNAERPWNCRPLLLLRFAFFSVTRVFKMFMKLLSVYWI